MGAVRLVQLDVIAKAHGTDLEGLWCWPLSQLRQALQWPEGVLLAVDRYRQFLGSNPSGFPPKGLLMPMDPEWPEGFRALPRPPAMVFWDGDPALWTPLARGQAVAVVGSRRASSHGLRVAELLGELLACAGWPVISGLAEGIDAAAHRGCLRAGGCPVAVLGTPLDRAYPAEHANLQADVRRAGLLLTESAPGARVQRASFALRNRLLVALAHTVVVAECPEKSGALISAREALSQRRSVWTVPGDVLRASTRGSNQLLSRGAQPILDPAAWVQSLGVGPLAVKPISSSDQHPQGTALKDPVLKALLEEGGSFQQLAQALGRSPAALAEQLVQLELQGLVVAEAGMRWRLA